MAEQKSERNLPAVIEQYPVAAPYSAPFVLEAESEEASIPLSHYLWILKRHRWKILSFVVACVLATLVVSSRLTPIYESTATVDIDRQTPTGVIGQESMRSTTNDADQFLATQVRLIQSDSVLRPVVDKYRLRDAEGELEVPAALAGLAEDAPVVLKRLKVTRPPNTYLLLISYRSPDPQLAADVANAIADSYLEHTYNIRYRSSASLSAFMEKQLEELKAKMERSSAALVQFERELNVINPEEKTSILSARLLQLNTEYTNAQADRVRKEAAYQSMRGGTLEAAQVSTQGESLRRLTERLNEAQEKFAEVKTHFGANHPEYKKAAAQLAEVQRLLETTTAEHQAAGGDRVQRGGAAGGHAAEGGAGDQGRVRQSERALLRVPGAQAGSRRRQDAVRRTGAQDQGGGHQRQLPEQFHPHRRPSPARRQARLPEPEAECAAGVPVLEPAGGGQGGAERRAGQHRARPRAGDAHAEGGSGGQPARGQELERAPGPGARLRRRPRAGAGGRATATTL